MPKSRITSPSSSERALVTPRRNRPRSSRSMGSPARSTDSARLSKIVDKFKEDYQDSFAVTPLSKTVLSDNTEIDMPRRRSWWRKVESSRDVIEVLDNDKQANPTNVLEELDVEVLSQEKKNYTMDLPESSDSESISSIVLPQRKLFTLKENVPQNKFGQVFSNRESLGKHNKTNFNDKTIEVGPKNLFTQTSKRPKPVFPSALLNMSLDKTGHKTKEAPTEVKGQPKTLFGNRLGTKRKNMFADFIVSESEDEIPEIQPKLFAFHKQSEPTRRSSATSRGLRDPSPTSSVTTDIEMEDWKLLPSSTMVEHQLQLDLTTPGKRARLSKLSEAKESTKDSTKQSDHSISFKNKSNKSTANDKSKSNNSNEGTMSNMNTLSSPSKIKDTSGAENIPDNVNQNANEVSNERNRTRVINNTITLRKPGLDESTGAKTNTTQNKSKVDEISLAENKPDVRNEISNTKDKTRVINKTVTLIEHLSENKDVDDVQDKQKNYNLAMNKVDTGDPQDQQENEEIALTYDDNDPGEQDNIENEKVPINDKTKTLCKDDNHDELQKPTDILEEQLSKIVTEDHVLQMETPMPNKSGHLHLINKVVEETPESKVDNKNKNTKFSLEEAVMKHVQENIQKEVVTGIEKIKKSSDEEQCASNIANRVQEEIEVESYEIVKNQENVEANEQEEISNDEIEDSEQNQINTSEQDKAEASQEIEAEEQTDADQELDEDEEEIETSEQNLQEQNDKGIDQQLAEHNDDENKELEQMQEDEEECVEEEEEIEEQVESDNEPEVSQEVEQQSGDEQDEEEEHHVSQEIEDQNDEQIKDGDTDTEIEEEQEIDLNESEQEDIQASEDEVENESDNEDAINESKVDDDQIESQVQSDQEMDYNDDEEEVNASDEADNNEQEIETHEETTQEPTEKTDHNITHDTTGRNRKKRQTETPEAILHEVSHADEDSFTAKGRNTSIRKTKSILKNFTIRPSIAPPRESTGLSDGTKNSSAEGSGWDSHRTTRKTLRQTFGRDFTPRKSLRALVMEKSAKRQTMLNEANAKLHQANSTEQDNQDFEMGVDEIVDPVESDHEISRRTRQTTLEMYLQKIKKENMERKQKIEKQVKNSLKANPIRVDILNFRMPVKPSIRRIKSLQSVPKVKRLKPTAIPLDDLPSELVEDMKYKPPKRFRPSNASWITKSLYKFLETKLEPKYDYKARIRAEKLVETIYNFVRDIRRLKVAPAHSVTELKREMARLDVVSTHFEFYNFFNDYLPSEVKIKVVPDIVNDIPLPREGIFAPILI